MKNDDTLGPFSPALPTSTKSIDPAITKGTRLQPQMINGVWIPDTYEVWRNGLFKRKVFVIPEGEEVPDPSPDRDCPHHHLAKLEKITGRGCYLSAIGQRVDDDVDLIGLTFLQGVSAELDGSGVDGGNSVILDAPSGATGSIGATDPLDPLGLKSLSDPASYHASKHASPGEQWTTIWVTHDVIANVQKIIELSRHVFPVKSSNARQISDFLSDSYDVNIGLVQRHHIVKRAGYHEVAGKHGWLLGKYWIGYGKVTADPNNDKLGRGLRAYGSEVEWLKKTEESWNHDDRSWIIRWMLATGFTAPLLRWLGERTFFVHHYFESGGGKTLISMLAQTAWGHHKDFSMALNRATQNSLTEIFKQISDLPILLDEGQGKTVDFSDFIMQATTEEHKARSGRSGGIQGSNDKPWRTLIKVTAEEPLAGKDKEDLGGQANRVIEVRHPGLETEFAKALWQWVDSAQHYGFAGIRFLQQLLGIVNDPKQIETLKGRHNEYTATIKKYTGKNGAQERQLGAIMLAEMLMLRWVYGWDTDKAVDTALRDACDIAKNWMRVKDTNDKLWKKACEMLIEHKSTNPNLYADVTNGQGLAKLSNHGTKTAQPIIACVNAGMHQDEIWYFPSSFHKLIKDKWNTPPDRVLEELSIQGILERGQDRIAKHRQIANAFKGKVYVIKMDRLLGYDKEQVTVTEPIEADVISNYLTEAPEEWYGQSEALSEPSVNDFDMVSLVEMT